MQMLQQYLGEQGARYATFVLTAFVLVIAVLIVWVLIRKALGSRLNFSDKPDRRGRAPRLGITESFNVDREGRRLVIVRRDNFEHLVMIGGPNDVVIETSILRGERLTVGRNDQRLSEPELIPSLPRPIAEALQPALSAPLPVPTIQAAPVQRVSVQPAPTPAPLQPRVAPRPPEPKIAIPVPTPVPTQRPVMPAPPSTVPTPEIKVEVAVQSPEPVVAPAPLPPVLPSIELPKAPVVSLPNVSATAVISPVAAPIQSVAATAKAAMSKLLSPKAKVDEADRPEAKVLVPPGASIQLPVEDKPVVSKPTLAERIKTNAFFSKKEVTSEQAPVPPPPPVASSRPVPSAPTVAKPVENAFAAEMRQLEEAARVVKSPSLGFGGDALPSPAPEMKKVIQPSPPPVTPPLPSQTLPAPTPTRLASKNPFDSLEEEMAKLLGRTPDGKG